MLHEIFFPIAVMLRDEANPSSALRVNELLDSTGGVSAGSPPGTSLDSPELSRLTVRVTGINKSSDSPQSFTPALKL